MSLAKSRFVEILGLALAASSLAGCMVGDSTDDDPTIDDSPLEHPDEDTVGSMVRAIEGTQGPAYSADVTQTPGMDVSSYQGAVNWSAAKSNGARFAYIKATEGVNYTSPEFAQQYNGSYGQGIIRGSYHFALPDRSSGKTQADYFFHHGGGWSNDGKTLPPAIDLEYNPYGATCYGKSAAGMVSWVHDFANEMKHLTGRDITIYTSTSWWSLCTGNNGGFSANPLWIPRYGSSVGTLPHGWSFQTIWQNADHGVFPGDHNLFNGAYARVQAFAH